MATTRLYAVLSASEISRINFSNLQQTKDTVRYTTDGNFFIVKYNSDLPTNPLQLTTPVLSGTTVTQAITTVNTTNWEIFEPTDLPNLDLWVDATEGVMTAAGNFFTDETATIFISGFPVTPEGLDPNNSTIERESIKTNNKNAYFTTNISGGNGGFIRLVWDRDKWKITLTVYTVEDEYDINYYSTDNTTYPWQANWGNGKAVYRTPTTFDIPATSGQKIQKWYNKNYKGMRESFLLRIGSEQPTYDTNFLSYPVVGIDNNTPLRFINTKPFTNYFSYYIVTTSALSSSNYSNPPPHFNNIISVQAGSLTPFQKGSLGINTALSAFGGNNLAFRSGSQLITLSSLNGLAEDGAAIFSVRANLEDGIDLATIGKNLSAQTITVTSATANEVNNVVLGGGGDEFRGVNTNFIEILVYRDYHDTNTARRIIRYLAAKWNIDL